MRHLEHINVAHDVKKKSLIVQVVTALVRVIRSEGIVLSEVGYISDLCRHLRKCLQATIKSVEEEINLNIYLQSSIEDCLLEVAKGVSLIEVRHKNIHIIFVLIYLPICIRLMTCNHYLTLWRICWREFYRLKMK